MIQGSIYMGLYKLFSRFTGLDNLFSRFKGLFHLFSGLWDYLINFRVLGIEGESPGACEPQIGHRASHSDQIQRVSQSNQEGLWPL